MVRSFATPPKVGDGGYKVSIVSTVPYSTTCAVYNRPLHVLCLLTTLFTLPLIFMGGLVTSTGTGMSVPDWPNTWGYNMFAVPWEIWVGPLAGGVFYEHAHRLKGTLVGFLAVSTMIAAFGPATSASWRKIFGWVAAAGLGLTLVAIALIPIFQSAGVYTPGFAKNYSHVLPSTVSLFLLGTVAYFSRRPEQRKWVRWATVALMIAVCLQGLLGGLRVTEVNVQLAMVHACTAQAFLGFAGFLTVATSKWWVNPLANAAVFAGTSAMTARSSLRWLGLAAIVVLFAQLTAGSLMRHNDAGLAISTFPDTYGGLLPPATADELHALNQKRIWSRDIGEVTFFQVWIHFIHRIGAIAVSVLLLTMAVATFKAGPYLQLRKWSVFLLVLLTSQIILGILTVLWRKPADVATAHVAVGAVCMLTTFVITTKAFRIAAAVAAMQPNRAKVDVEMPTHAPLAATLS